VEGRQADAHGFLRMDADGIKRRRNFKNFHNTLDMKKYRIYNRNIIGGERMRSIFPVFNIINLALYYIPILSYTTFGISRFISWCYRGRNISNINPQVKINANVVYRIHSGLLKALNLGAKVNNVHIR
jgi:hypothetical protein